MRSSCGTPYPTSGLETLLWFVYMNTEVNVTAAAVSKPCDCTLALCLLSGRWFLCAIITHDMTNY